MTPYISVIITAYNRKDYLLDAFNSAINQTLDRKKYEIIVSQNFKYQKIDNFIKKNEGRLIYFEGGNIGKQLIEAIKQSRGKIISFLDDDDLFEKNKLLTVYNIFNKNKNLGFLHNAAYYINNNNRLLSAPLDKHVKNCKTILTHNNITTLKLLRVEHDCIPVNMSRITIKKSLLLGFLNTLKKIHSSQDFFFYFVALASLPSSYLVFLDKKLTRFRVHESASFSTNNYETFKNKICFNYETFKKVCILLEGYIEDKRIKKYIEISMREGLIDYTFYSSNHRLVALSSYFKNFIYNFILNPRLTVLRGLQVVFYILAPEKFRRFNYLRVKRYFESIQK